jgi:hypothetical protein
MSLCVESERERGTEEERECSHIRTNTTHTHLLAQCTQRHSATYSNITTLQRRRRAVGGSVSCHICRYAAMGLARHYLNVRCSVACGNCTCCIICRCIESIPLQPPVSVPSAAVLSTSSPSPFLLDNPSLVLCPPTPQRHLPSSLPLTASSASRAFSMVESAT